MLRRTVALAASVAASAGLLVLTSCTAPSHPSSPATSSRTTTSPAPGGTAPSLAPSAPLPATARAALGNLRTLDPCSLVDLATLKASGSAALGDPQSLDYCVVKLTARSGPVELHVGETATTAQLASTSVDVPAPRSTERLETGQQVVAGSPGLAGCQDDVAFTDGVALLVSAAPVDGPATTATCAAADAALRGALAIIAAARVAHRTYPKHSLGPVDACTALAPDVVQRFAGLLGTSRSVTSPAGHQCAYGRLGATYVSLVLAAAYARFDGGPGSTTMTAAKHQVVLVAEQPDGRPGECIGYGPHIPFPSGSGQPAMEMAELHVALPTVATDEQACTLVRTLAPAVFARLP